MSTGNVTVKIPEMNGQPARTFTVTISDAAAPHDDHLNPPRRDQRLNRGDWSGD